MNNKIGILGGTFDPIHIGHLILAETAYNKFKLDKILIMPTPMPPHKEKYSSSLHRSNMAKIVCEDNEHFEYSDFEMKRQGNIYTADTLLLLKAGNPDNDYYFIIGADSLFAIEEWMSPEVIFDNATILVAQRDFLDNDKILNQKSYLEKKYKAKISIVEIANIEISSTNILEKIKNNESVRYMVPDKVLDYINTNKLYKD